MNAKRIWSELVGFARWGRGLRVQRPVLVVAVLTLLCSASLADLGRIKFVNTPTASLEATTMPLAKAVRTRAFVGRIGGVAFDGVASPSLPGSVEDLELSYDASRPDGERLLVRINDGEAVTAPIHDWQLVPIARVAESGIWSCVTILGNVEDLENPAFSERAQEMGTRVVRYHPALEDTLLGLRILQLDLLIISGEAVELPTDDEDEYVLGGGESEPNRWLGAMHQRKLLAWMDGHESPFDSYVVSDIGQRVTFSTEDGSLVLSGDPYYYCWRNAGSAPGFDEEAAYREALGAIERELRLREFRRERLGGDRFGLRGAVDDTAFIRSRINALLESDELEGLSGASVESLLQETLEGNPRLRLLDEASRLEALWLELEVLKRMLEVEYNEAFSTALSGKQENLRGINPAVWDSAVALMRYGAFFRYCKAEHPEAWGRFLRSISSVEPEPAVRTPGLIEMPVE